MTFPNLTVYIFLNGTVMMTMNFSVVLLTWDQIVRQYIIQEKIMACMNILAACKERSDQVTLNFA